MSISTSCSTPSATTVRSRLKMRPNPAAGKAGGQLKLDGEMLEIVEIRLDRKLLGPKDYKVTPTHFVLPKPPAKAFTLDITTTINPEANKALQGLYRSRGVYCTQCEAEGFRRITYFLDRPDVLVDIHVPRRGGREDGPVLLANGNPVEAGKLDGGRHFVVWHDPHPKPCYLFALVGGDLGRIASTFKTASAGRKRRSQDLRRAWQGDARRLGDGFAQALHALGRAPRSAANTTSTCSTSSRCPDFNMGAMENKGLNIFNDRLILASPETATDANFESIESVVAHEYFHNWTGNRITCRDWFQLCLKEGLTVYRDQEFSADERSRDGASASLDVRQLRATQFAEDAGPPRPPRSARHLHRDQQLLYGDRLREGCRGRPHDRDPARGRGFPPRHGSLFRAS